MQLIVDNSKCQGHARCNAMAPEVFELDDDGYIATRSGEIPAGLEAKAKIGVDSCPEQALSLIP
ncbi:MAG: ferredoxin [Frankiales bacterium]|nr:ferredoxin [Frankiales bacterium]